MIAYNNGAVSTRLGTLKERLMDESKRVDRSINWIIKRAVERYLDCVDQELKEIELKRKVKCQS